MNFSLNTFFKEIYVINMDKDIERLDSVNYEMNKLNSTYIRVPGVIPTDNLIYNEGSFFGKYFAPYVSIASGKAHKSIWEKIVNQKIENVLILEDDVKFTNNIESVLPQAFSELPKDWDIFFLGSFTSCDNHAIVEPNEYLHSSTKKYSEHLNQGKIYYGVEAYALSYKGAQKLLDQLKKISYYIDYQITYDTNNINMFYSNPIVAYQYTESDYETSKIKTPFLLNNLVKNIRINNKCYNDKRTINWIFTIPIIRLYFNILTFNVWCFILFCIVLLLPYKSIYITLLIYLFLDFIYNPSKNIKNYLPFIFVILFGIIVRRLFDKYKRF